MQQLQKVEQSTPAFSDKGNFEHAQRVAQMLASSDLVPQSFKGNIQNTMIALEMAYRIGASPLMVMQNLHVIQGKPSWSSSFIVAAINSCGKFSPLRYEVSGTGDSRKCYAWALDAKTGDRLEGPEVTMQMAKEEGWLGKPGSKWKTMPDLMIRYRAAAFFGRLYAPEIMMGMQTAEETQDVQYVSALPKVDKEVERVQLMIQQADNLEELSLLEDSATQYGQTDLFNQRQKELAA